MQDKHDLRATILSCPDRGTRFVGRRPVPSHKKRKIPANNSSIGVLSSLPR